MFFFVILKLNWDLLVGVGDDGTFVALVRRYDYHHYLCLLKLPPNTRKAAFALHAFNVETSRVMDVASDPRIGLMRLFWWQEAIDKIYADKPVEAQINDVRRDFTDIPETIEELEKYAEDTVSTLLYMILQTGAIRSTAVDHAASHVGKASGLLCLQRSLPYHASPNGPFVLYQLKWQPDMVSNFYLQKSFSLAVTVPSEARSVLLPAVPSQVLLESLSQILMNVVCGIWIHLPCIRLDVGENAHMPLDSLEIDCFGLSNVCSSGELFHGNSIPLKNASVSWNSIPAIPP
ncbi:hypothetical protein SADUNF_Sadunf03G0082400 [Salix dunnii]|uniref:Phytoene synthase n=1 Tax=Salix dunnii TaxID=1413687 RepID=A0A835KHI9_9ROSI|nr:hypothetical protein SADUNF_Sadunf03G0082400 [Salix dunnii]